LDAHRTRPFIVLTEDTSMVVLNARTGHAIGRVAGLGWRAALLPNGSAGVAADAQGGVVRFTLPNGDLVWHSDPLCAAVRGLPTLQRLPLRYAVSLIVASDRDLFVGCRGGRLWRLDVETGRARASRVLFDVNDFTQIRALPAKTMAVEGFSSGALIFRHLALVRRADLRPLITPLEDTQLLSVVGNIAILYDTCCFLADADWPGTILRVDLRSGSASQPLHLRPLPHRSTDRRPNGIGAEAAVIRSHLFLGVPPMLYDLGNARRSDDTRKAILSNLDEPPMFFADGSALITRRSPDGTDTHDLIDLASHVMHVRRRFASMIAPVFGYDAKTASGAFTVGDTSAAPMPPQFERSTDGAAIVVPYGCGLIAATDDDALASCTSGVGASVAQSVASFAFAPKRGRQTYGHHR